MATPTAKTPAQLTDPEFRLAMEECRVAGDGFHHRDHIRLAWIYLQDASQAEAADSIRRTIRRYARHHGATQKYHETMTLAWMRLVASAIRSTSHRASGTTFEAFVSENSFLLDKDALKRFYSTDLLSSDRARQEWVEPDLAGLPGAP
jgi:hypothetical protein